MGLLKTAILGAAVYGAFKYITKKDETTGRSVADNIKEKAPEWMEKAKSLKDDFKVELERQRY
ncbi:MAG: YtxH domain-containing protein [Bacteroidota bacterium]